MKFNIENLKNKESPDQKRAKEKAGAIYDSIPPAERINAVLEELEHISNSEYIDRHEIENNIIHIDQTSKNSFVRGIMLALKPVFKLIEENPREYERIRREVVFSEPGNIKINELLYYGKYNNGDIHLHIAPHEHAPAGEKMMLLKRGLKQLAEVVNDDPSIGEANATSWIVAEAPRVLEKLGFVLHGEVEDENKQDIPETSASIHHATISRKVLLNKHLTKQSPDT